LPYGRPRTEKERKERHKRLHDGEEPPKERLGLRWRRGGGHGRGRGYDEYEAEIIED
jgi:hypothetical protein